MLRGGRVRARLRFLPTSLAQHAKRPSAVTRHACDKGKPSARGTPPLAAPRLRLHPRTAVGSTVALASPQQSTRCLLCLHDHVETKPSAPTFDHAKPCTFDVDLPVSAFQSFPFCSRSCMYMYVYIYIYIYICVCVCVCIYIYIHIRNCVGTHREGHADVRS